jgi:hypothetical protein
MYIYIYIYSVCLCVCMCEIYARTYVCIVTFFSKTSHLALSQRRRATDWRSNWNVLALARKFWRENETRIAQRLVRADDTLRYHAMVQRYCNCRSYLYVCVCMYVYVCMSMYACISCMYVCISHLLAFKYVYVCVCIHEHLAWLWPDWSMHILHAFEESIWLRENYI